MAETRAEAAGAALRPKAAYMATELWVHCVTWTQVITFTANGSAKWEAQFSTGPSPDTMTYTLEPNMENVANRQFFTSNPA